ncbi:MAG: sensor histidine kinase [Bacteroidales bacterium]|nr:sensor histidine kinase [Bacteroidales bacterium]
MEFKTSQKVPETAIYLIIWLVIFIIPVLVTTSNTGRFDKQVIIGWVRMTPFVAIFIINTVWLIPEFLFKGKTGTYLIAVVVLSLLFVLVWDYVFPMLQELIKDNQQPQFDLQRPRFDGQRPPLPNQRSHIDRPWPPPDQQQLIPRERLTGPNQRIPEYVVRILRIFNQVIIAWLVVGFNVAIKVTNKWFKDEQKKRELEKEHLKSELAFLQNQVSPHFFMNTLNNIHAQIDIDTKDAQGSIVTLSKMMRYLLYESDRGDTTLKKEIEFLKSYVELMKLRVHEEVNIDLKITVVDEDIKLQPFLFISFIENAFKHGISYNEKSFIKIELKQNIEFIEFSCINSLSVQNKITNPYSGVGLENIKKRLNLLYNNDYQLNINEFDSEFKVLLKIPMNEN